MTFPSHIERFARVASTQDVVRGWLVAGVPEVCVAVADRQTSGRGRLGRTWVAPPGAALLCSLGFRPGWLEAAAVWRLPAVVSLAMASAAEEAAGLPDGAIRCKWPNDLVLEGGGGREAGASTADGPGSGGGGDVPRTGRKVAGVLGESDGLGTADPTVVVGIGINVDWDPAAFPADLATRMASLRSAAGGRPVDRDALLEGFLAHLEARLEALRVGRFPVDDWAGRQLTTGRLVRLEGHAREPEVVLAMGVDHRTGALLVADPGAPGDERAVHAGEVTAVRLVPESAARPGQPARAGDVPAGRV